MWMHEGAAMRVIETSGPVRQLAFNPDGRQIAFVERWMAHAPSSGYESGRTWAGWVVRWLDLERNFILRCYQPQNDWHIWLRLASGQVISLGVHGEAEIYDVNRTGVTNAFSLPFWRSYLRSDNRYAADCSDNGKFMAWFDEAYDNSHVQNEVRWIKIENHSQIGAFRPLEATPFLRFSHDSQYLASAGKRRLTIWAMEKLESIATWQTPRPKRNGAPRDEIRSVEFSIADDSVLINTDRCMYIWDLRSSDAQIIVPSIWRDQPVMACSTDSRLAGFGARNQVEIWDLSLLRHVETYQWPVSNIQSLAFAPDGMTMAAGGEGKIVIWDLDDL
jgi:WD40 repeat protein